MIGKSFRHMSQAATPAPRAVGSGQWAVGSGQAGMGVVFLG